MAKRLRRLPSDPLHDVANGEELSLYATTPNSSESAQVNLSHSLTVVFSLLCLHVHLFLFTSFHI